MSGSFAPNKTDLSGAVKFWIEDVFKVEVSRTKLAEFIGVDEWLISDPAESAIGDGNGARSGLFQHSMKVVRAEKEGEITPEQRELIIRILRNFPDGFPERIALSAVRLSSAVVPECPDFAHRVADTLARFCVSALVTKDRGVEGFESALVQAAMDRMLGIK